MVDNTVDMAVTRIEQGSKFTADGGRKPMIHVYGRRPDDAITDDPVHIAVEGFEPYFYAPEPDGDQDVEDIVAGSDVITRAGSTETEVRGQTVRQMFTQMPREVAEARETFDEHWEADVRFNNRFRYDKKIQSGVRVDVGDADPTGNEFAVHHTAFGETFDTELRYRTMFYDIEVDDSSGFPDPEDATEEVLSVAAHDSGRDEYVLWLNASEGQEVESVRERFEADTTPFEGYTPAGDWDTDGPIEASVCYPELRTFESEWAMLDDFVGYVSEADPDLLSGWNFTEFDALYVINRLDELGLDSDRLARGDRQSYEKRDFGSQVGVVEGRTCIDLMKAYDRSTFTELDSTALDTIGADLLDVGKTEYVDSYRDLWTDSPERFLSYALRDVELCVEIERQKRVLGETWSEVARIAGLEIGQAPIPNDTVDSYILHEVHGDIVLPSKGENADEDYEGATVFDAPEGMFENVVALDLASLYPMSMRTINASPETRVDPETYDGETIESPNGVHFRSEPDGLIKHMVEDLLDERQRFKDLRDQYQEGDPEYDTYDEQQGVIKRIMNSFYGVLGFDRFRLYDSEMGAAVTACGRAVLKATATAVESLGYSVLYGDTDSAYVQLESDLSDEEIEAMGYRLEREINDAYDEFACEQFEVEEHYFDLEFEKIYRRYYQAGQKKRYAGRVVWKDGHWLDDPYDDIVGFETQRSSTSEVTKTVMSETFNMILEGASEDAIREYVHGELQKVENGDYGLDQIAVPQGIGKPFSEYDNWTDIQIGGRGAYFANLVLGTNFGEGDKPMHVYLDMVDPSWYEANQEQINRAAVDDPEKYAQWRKEERIIAFEDPAQIPDEFEVDLDEQITKILRRPIGRIVEPLGISWSEIRANNKQTGLGVWS